MTEENVEVEKTDIQRIRDYLHQAEMSLNSAYNWADDFPNLREDIVEAMTALSEVKGEARVISFPRIYGLKEVE